MDRITLRHLTGSRANEVDEFSLDVTAELLMGRDPAASVRFDLEADGLVGRRHARIVRGPGPSGAAPVFVLYDLDSRNGTYLNRERVVGYLPLRPGDLVQLGAGGPELRFEVVSLASPPP
jgi:serine protease Do